MFWWMRPVDRPCGWAIFAASGASNGTPGRFAVATGSQARVSHAADRAPLVHGRAELEELRRALGIPAVLVLPGPLHAHRAAQRPGEQHRLAGRVLGARLPVGAGAVHDR